MEEDRYFDEDIKNANQEWKILEYKKAIKKIWGNNVKIITRWDKISQIDFKTDFLIKTIKGRVYSIDSKTKHYKYLNSLKYPLELQNIIYPNKENFLDEQNRKYDYCYPGWLYSSQANRILYCCFDEIEKILHEICCFSLLPFKEDYFKDNITKLEKKSAPTIFSNNAFQVTWFALAHKNFLEKNAQFFYYWRK